MDTKTAVSFAAGAALGSAAALAIAHRSLCLSPPWYSALTKRLFEFDVPAVATEALPAAQPVQSFDLASDNVLAEQFTRNIQFFGMDSQLVISNAFVTVVGLGGVGSHAAHLLLRSGVRKLRLIDFDQVTLSSLNRHAVATRRDVGTPKADCLKAHFHEIVPEAEVDARVAMYTQEAAEELLSGQPDFVLDAIDNIDTKVALLAACKQRGIPVLCVAGAGAKADPTRIRVADISESSIDPLARAVRQRLRKDCGIDGGVPVLLSTEKPRCKLVDAPGDDPLDYQIVPNFRVRTIPVLGTMPAMFGMAAAAHILCQLAGQPFTSEPLIKLQAQQYETQLHRLREREELVYGNHEGPAVDIDDIIFLVREVWRGMSARAPPTVLRGSDKGLQRSTANLVLTRWDASRPAVVDNLVLLTFDEAEAHEAAILEHVRQSEPDFVRLVEQRLARAQAYGS